MNLCAHIILMAGLADCLVENKGFWCEMLRAGCCCQHKYTLGFTFSAYTATVKEDGHHFLFTLRCQCSIPYEYTGWLKIKYPTGRSRLNVTSTSVSKGDRPENRAPRVPPFKVTQRLRNWHGYTGWLKLKYPTGQNAISQQPCEIFIHKFLDLYGRDPATILIFLN